MIPTSVVADPPAPATPAAATPLARTQRQRLLLGLVAVELVVLFAPTVAWLVDRWTMSVWQNAHGMFVPPLSAWLAWQALREHRHLPVESSKWGFLLLIPALLIHALDAGMHTQLLSAIALVPALAGLSLVLLGGRRTRLIAFPLLLLGFALPIPLAFTEPLQLVLRQIAATSTAFFLPLVGISVFLDGTTLHTTSGVVSVSDACSGFSTLYAAATVAALVAYNAPSWNRAILVVVAAAPVAIAANILRVIALTLMVAWGSGWLLETFVHPLSGMLTFALALPVLFWLGSGRTIQQGEVMIAPRHLPALAILLTICLVPSILHSYIGSTVTDGRAAAGLCAWSCSACPADRPAARLSRLSTPTARAISLNVHTGPH